MAALTPEEQQQLTELQDKQAQAAWEDAEAARQAKLAAITPAAAALGSIEAVNAQVNALKAARNTVDADTAMRLSNIITVLSLDGIAILSAAQQLAVPIAPPIGTAVSSSSSAS